MTCGGRIPAASDRPGCGTRLEAGHPRRSGKRRAPARLAGWCGPCPISFIQAGTGCGEGRLRVRTSAVQRVIVSGGGLAGSEAALLLAEGGVRVVLHEQKPERRSPAHKEDGLAELVCSNSLRSDNPENAIGLLHEELRRLGSPVLEEADRARVPAGDALAVDRVRFSGALTRRIADEPLIELVREEALELPPGPDPCIVATGPLTGEPLARSLAEAVGGSALAFYDALAPIVAAESKVGRAHV